MILLRKIFANIFLIGKIITLFILFFTYETRSEELVIALSTKEVAISSSYSGTDITVFGFIDKDENNQITKDNLDVVASVVGPKGNVELQHKGKFGPLWLVDKRMRFSGIPLYFAILSGQSISKIMQEDIRSQLKFGLEYFFPNQENYKNITIKQVEDESHKALIDIRREEGAFVINEKAIQMLRPNIFTIRINLPGKAPTGLYLINVSLLRDGNILQTRQVGFVVRKIGFDAFIANIAREKVWFYGISTILIAIFCGWFANIIFRKE